MRGRLLAREIALRNAIAYLGQKHCINPINAPLRRRPKPFVLDATIDLHAEAIKQRSRLVRTEIAANILTLLNGGRES